MEEELSLADALRPLWESRALLGLSVFLGVMAAMSLWLITPVTTGTTYQLSVYPDGAPIFSKAAIADQITTALRAVGYAPTVQRNGSISVTATGKDYGADVVSVALTVTATIQASVRRAASKGGKDCGELCARLDAWADASEKGMFELITVSTAPYQSDRRLLYAVLAFCGFVFLAIAGIYASMAICWLKKAFVPRPQNTARIKG